MKNYFQDFLICLENHLTEFLLTQIALPYPKKRDIENQIFLTEYQK